MKQLNRYNVGMGSVAMDVMAPTAALAAMYFSLHLCNTNNPFMAVVYHENGNDWSGDYWWINPMADEAHVKMVVERLPKEDLELCHACLSPMTAIAKGFDAMVQFCADYGIETENPTFESLAMGIAGWANNRDGGS